MNNIENLCDEMKRIESVVSDQAERSGHGQRELLDFMGRIQYLFSDQRAGRDMVTMLHEARYHAMAAEAELYLLKSEIQGCIRKIRT